MKVITIERLNSPESLDVSSPNWKKDSCYYILTYLASMSSGCIWAEWSRTNHEAIWYYTAKSCHTLKPDSFDGEILVHKDILQFRSILGRLGLAASDEGYLGAGTFKIKFNNDSESDKFFAIIFGNERGIGYWIQLRVINDPAIEK